MTDTEIIALQRENESLKNKVSMQEKNINALEAREKAVVSFANQALIKETSMADYDYSCAVIGLLNAIIELATVNQQSLYKVISDIMADNSIE